MSMTVILGAWIAVFLTFGIFSYLYKDNPFYKTAEHLFLLDPDSAKFIRTPLAIFGVQCRIIMV